MGLLDKDTELLPRLGYTANTIPSADNTLLDEIILEAERIVKEFVGYDIEQATYTEFLPDNNQVYEIDPIVDHWEVFNSRAISVPRRSFHDRLVVSQIPIRSIVSIYEERHAQYEAPGGSFPAETLLTEGQDYQVDWFSEGFCKTGAIYRTGVWSPYRRSIKITYVAGYTDAELDGKYRVFKDVTLQLILDGFKRMKRHNIIDDHLNSRKGKGTMQIKSGISMDNEMGVG